MASILDIFDLFSHPNITFLRLDNSDNRLEKVDRIQSLFTDLPNKLPRLERLLIGIAQEGSFRQVEDDIANAISSFPNLKTISIHPEWHTPPVAEAISTRPRLHMLDAYDDWEDPKRLPPQLPVFAHPLGPNHLRSLTKMAITIGFEQAVRCFSPGRCVLDQVTSFTMNSRYYERRETYSRMLELLPRVFPNVCKLFLDANSDLVPVDMLESRVTFDDLQPLLSLQSLTDLALNHSTPFQLRGTDLKEIVSALKKLKKLSFNHEPIKRSTTSLHLSALSELCFEGNSLYEIQLYVDMSASQLPEDYQQDGRRLHPTLECLFIGTADLLADDIPAISKYLSHVLPVGFDPKLRFQSNLEWDNQEVYWQLREATAALLSA
ncbi:hypothetical protein ONZ45_g18982 [Pleurotus djamor]|nr:hypothetical protein ONZ45_g18982 [Pleurotus djamor]